MEEDTIFYGGAAYKFGRSGLGGPSRPGVNVKGFTPYRSALDLKKQRQTGRVSAKKASISKVSAQKAETSKFQASKLEDVQAKAAEVKRTKLAELEAKFDNPMFKQNLAKSIDAKQGAFGKKLSPDELRAKVEAEMNKIKENAELKAQKAAADASSKISNNNNAITAASKATLSGKISQLKADFDAKLQAIRNRGADPGGKTRVEDPSRIRDNSADARNKAEIAKNSGGKADSERFRNASTKAGDSGGRIEKPRTKGSDGDGDVPPGRIGDGDGPVIRDPGRTIDDAKNRSQIAKNNSRTSLDRVRSLVTKVKNFLRKILRVLGQLLAIVIPIIITYIPLLIAPPKPPPSLNPFTFTIRPPPPPIISPEGDNNIFGLYVPGSPGSSQPPEAALPFEYYNESFGNIVFQLTEQPSETISFQVSSLSESLEFDENIVTFPLDNWSAPVYLNFISNLETSSDGIVGDINEDVSGKLSKLKQEKRVDKRPDISIGSLDDYSTTNEEIEARRRRLEYMLRPSETIQQALAKINKRVQLRESIAEPTYYGGYSEYRGIVEPTYDTKISEELLEPTYDNSEYKILEDKVYPSEKIIKEETYEPIEEIVEPTHDDSEYKDYVHDIVPTLDGGQEEESFEEDILPELDYDTIVSRIDETQLSDEYKAEIEFILLEEISSEVNILVSVLDPTWTLKPNIITFNREIPATTSFFFSQEIYLTLENLYAEQYANQVEDQFEDYIDEEYESGMNSISEQEEQNRIKEQEIYNDVYDKVYQRELSKIEDSEYILNQLGGYSKPTVSKLFKRTRKLPRIVK